MDIDAGCCLGNECCTRSRLGVMLGQGYQHESLVFVRHHQTISQQTGLVPIRVLLVESSSSSRGDIDPSTSVSTDNLVSWLVSCGGFRS
jgi:hypothetical protein